MGKAFESLVGELRREVITVDGDSLQDGERWMREGCCVTPVGHLNTMAARYIHTFFFFKFGEWGHMGNV